MDYDDEDFKENYYKRKKKLKNDNKRRAKTMTEQISKEISNAATFGSSEKTDKSPSKQIFDCNDKNMIKHNQGLVITFCILFFIFICI